MALHVSLPSIVALAFLIGVMSHICYFNYRLEHHFQAPKYFLIWFFLFWCSTYFFYNCLQPITTAVTNTVIVNAAYFGGLYTSLVVYRAFLHPLKKFPGPFGARLSNLWFSSKLFSALDGHKQLLHLHDAHGPFLRIGSSDLSIIHPAAVEAIYGQRSGCSKSAWYDLTDPLTSLQTMRVRGVHDRRRRIWSPAFSDKAIQEYETRVKSYRSKLVEKIEAFGEEPVNVSKWFNLYSFDVMGDLAFARGFEMLDASKEHWAIKLLNEGMEPIGYRLPIWAFRLVLAIPGLKQNKDWFKFIDYCKERVEERIKRKVEKSDIMTSLLAPTNGERPTGHDLEVLYGDSELIVVAGSDTTAASLTYIFYELCRHPEHITKLREEMTAHTSQGEVSQYVIHKLDHLTGVIYEALRLHPPVPSGLQRVTPPEGIHVGDTHIPGNMTVFCPQYVMGRSEEIYTDAKAFIPERWYSQPELVKHKSAFVPFSTGRDNCIGKPLALLNIRLTVAKLLTTFNVKFAPSEDGSSLENNTRDHFTLGLGELNLVFTKQ